MKLLIDVNQLLWNGPILVMLFGTHVYFTLRLRLVQRKIGYGISLSLSDGSKNKKGFGRFGSLTTTLAATLGTGNIIGISTAVFLGGPGAVFWCWLTGLLGMATTYAETFLCHHFRYQGHGGPMYILHFLLHKKTLAEGDVFDIDTRCLFFGQEELPSQFECRVLENNTEVASAVLTVYRPRDLQEFV